MPIYSYSSLETFKQCPQKYKFKYVENIKMETGVIANVHIGTVVHLILKKLYNHGADSVLIPLDEAIKLYNDEWNKLNRDDIEVSSEYHTVDDYIRLGREMLENYYHKFKPFKDGILIGTELFVMFDLPGTDFKLRSYIDRIVKRDDGTVEIWDYKTGKNLLSPTDKMFIFQMGLYQLAVQSKFKEFKNIELVMYFLRHEETVRYTMNPDELDLLAMNLRNTINDTINSERLDSFAPKEDYHCQWCEYHNICPAKRHKKMLEESQSDEKLLFSAEQLKEKANTYLETDSQFKKLKKRLEEQKVELKDITRETGLKVLEGDKGQVKISLNNQESFVTKTQNEKAFIDLVILCRELNLDSYFIPDTRSILKEVYQRKLLSDDQLKQLEEFVRIKESGRITVKLAHESKDKEDIV